MVAIAEKRAVGSKRYIRRAAHIPATLATRATGSKGPLLIGDERQRPDGCVPEPISRARRLAGPLPHRALNALISGTSGWFHHHSIVHHPIRAASDTSQDALQLEQCAADRHILGQTELRNLLEAVRLVLRRPSC